MDKFKKPLIALAVGATLLNIALLAGTLIAPLTPTVVAETDKEKGPRKFYLTKTMHNGSQALTACAFGYHMASLWEVFDPSNLRYDTELGLTTADSGFGPPSGSIIHGWIRTGNEASPASGALGQTNCNAWTSGDGTDVGTIVGLSPFWVTGSGSTTIVSPWSAGPNLCIAPRSVWCVQD